MKVELDRCATNPEGPMRDFHLVLAIGLAAAHGCDGCVLGSAEFQDLTADDAVGHFSGPTIMFGVLTTNVSRCYGMTVTLNGTLYPIQDIAYPNPSGGDARTLTIPSPCSQSTFAYRFDGLFDEAEPADAQSAADAGPITIRPPALRSGVPFSLPTTAGETLTRTNGALGRIVWCTDLRCGLAKAPNGGTPTAELPAGIPPQYGAVVRGLAYPYQPTGAPPGKFIISRIELDGASSPYFSIADAPPVWTSLTNCGETFTIRISRKAGVVDAPDEIVLHVDAVGTIFYSEIVKIVPGPG
jgi:hypothetical protein